ncbi:phage holin [Paraclostridium bifermentans]|uniref:phage holin n=1 Tax=Paraclostridium bifermentans TaxID=1490 RepID=UPI00359C0FFF
MSETVIELLLSIVSLVITIVGGYLVGYLKRAIGTTKLKEYYSIAKTIVMSIEQTQGTLIGEEKKKLAVDKLIQVTNGKLNEEEIDRLIEAAVYEIKKMIKESDL